MLLLIASPALVILLLYAAYYGAGRFFRNPNIALSAINMLYVAIVIWADADSLQCREKEPRDSRDSLLLSGRMQQCKEHYYARNFTFVKPF